METTTKKLKGDRLQSYLQEVASASNRLYQKHPFSRLFEAQTPKKQNCSHGKRIRGHARKQLESVQKSTSTQAPRTTSPASPASQNLASLMNTKLMGHESTSTPSIPSIPSIPEANTQAVSKQGEASKQKERRRNSRLLADPEKAKRGTMEKTPKLLRKGTCSCWKPRKSLVQASPASSAGQPPAPERRGPS